MSGKKKTFNFESTLSSLKKAYTEWGQSSPEKLLSCEKGSVTSANGIEIKTEKKTECISPELLDELKKNLDLLSA